MMQSQSLARYAEIILDQNDRALTPVVQMIQAQQAQAFESLRMTFPQTPKPDVVLYEILANRVRSQDYQSVGQLAGQYRNQMENIGKLRPGSSSKTAKRRMQEILNEHVYGVRVPQHELPLLVINGRITGGQRLYDDIHFSNGHTS
jgi:hypothetical protein